MNNISKLEEKIIKVSLIDYILDSYSHVDIIIPEFPYLLGNRRADIFAIIENKMIAFEIKSQNDNLLKLEEQVQDYLTTFNEVYLVLDMKFKNEKTLQNLDKRCGILFYMHNQLFFKRKAKTIKRLSKKNTVQFFTSIPQNKKFKSINEYRSFLLTKTTTELQNLALHDIKQKYNNSYYIFLEERGNKTSIEALENFRFQEKDNYALLIQEE